MSNNKANGFLFRHYESKDNKKFFHVELCGGGGKMRLLIIDDDNEFIEILYKDLFCFFSEFNEKIEIIKITCDFNNIHYDEKYDFIFLDIDLKDISGFDLAKRIKEHYPNSVITFVSAMNNLIHSSLRIQPFFFIRKSDYKKDLLVFFDLVKEQVKKKSIIEVSSNYTKNHIFLEDIVYIEVKTHLLSIYTINDVYYDNRSLKEFLGLLDNIKFVQIHKSYIINFDYLISYKKGGKIELINKSELNIGRSFKKHFEERYKEFLLQ